MAKFRIVDAALFLATIAGAITAVSSARKLHGLQTEHARLSLTTGNLVVTDPAQLHMQALETGDPLHFAWRVYAPAGRMVLSASSGGGGSSTSTNASTNAAEFIARIRFTPHRGGQMSTYYTFGNGAGYTTFGSPETFQFLREHWKDLVIEQLGTDQPAQVKPGQPVTVLRISIPESLASEARQTLGESHAKRLIPNVFECRLELKP